MRLKSILAALAAIASIGLAHPDRAGAFGYHREQPEGWGQTRAVNHWVYYPRYAHNYNVDPYAYRYSPRGYYPYYNSRFWRPAHVIRERNHQHYNHWNVQAPRYRYHPSWGRPRHWHHREWHHKHHGYHHGWHW